MDNNFLNPPPFFMQYCAICGIKDERAKTSWDKILQKSQKEFSDWFFDHYKTEGNKTYEQILKGLSKEKHDEVLKKSLELFAYNLDSFYTVIKKNLPYETKQVLNGYVSTNKTS